MKVRLVVETAPLAQAVTEYIFTGGRVVIGRGDDADWTLNDPDMFVSRQHCILTEKDGQMLATDASSGGLFIDNAANPVGTGNAVVIEPGMRLRMGDVVLRVEDAAAPVSEPAPSGQTGRMVFDFGSKPDEPPSEPIERPASLPDPFGLSGGGRNYERRRDPKPSKPLDQDDDFALDLRKQTLAAETPPHRSGGYFDSSSPAAATLPIPRLRPRPIFLPIGSLRPPNRLPKPNPSRNPASRSPTPRRFLPRRVPLMVICAMPCCAAWVLIRHSSRAIRSGRPSGSASPCACWSKGSCNCCAPVPRPSKRPVSHRPSSPART